MFLVLRYLLDVIEKFSIDEQTTTVGISGILEVTEMVGRLSDRLYVFKTKNILRREHFK